MVPLHSPVATSRVGMSSLFSHADFIATLTEAHVQAVLLVAKADTWSKTGSISVPKAMVFMATKTEAKYKTNTTRCWYEMVFTTQTIRQN